MRCRRWPVVCVMLAPPLRCRLLRSNRSRAAGRFPGVAPRAHCFQALARGARCPDGRRSAGCPVRGPAGTVRSHEGREGTQRHGFREKYTDRAKGFLQSAQGLALREGHQRFLPEHLLKVLLDDPEGMAANLIQAAGGNAKAAQQAIEELLRKQPKVEGGGAGQLYMAPETARLFDQAEQVAKKAGDSLRHGRAAAAGAGDERHRRRQGAEGGRRRPEGAEQRDQRAAQGPHRAERQRRGRLRRAEEVHARPDRGRALRQARPGDRPRRGDPAGHPGAVAPDQEQPGADRRARRRQDRDRRGPGAAHRRRRRAGIPARPPAAVARPGRAGRRCEVPRRVRGAAEGAAAARSSTARATSSCSSTSCTRWSARARPRGRWTPPTCSSRPWPAASCTASAPPRSTSTASTSRRTRPWRGASSRCSSASPTSTTRSRSCAG